MIVEIKKRNNDELESGAVIVSSDNDKLLVIETGAVFNVFDLEENILRCYDTKKDFEEDYTIKEVYTDNEIKIVLDKIY